ncbi:hypothetical protein VNI00_011258 [Paramarasmius palmivorus]|uniref:Coiled-coil domain-containing protein 170 n=1 Tax=Paramarasmius palmivorus TaxID=297713 RepID=A0AAW0CH11_9AGAR
MQQLTPPISNQLREDFARECQRSPTAEELSLWRSENQHRARLCCSLVLEELSSRVKKTLGLDSETFITLFREHMGRRVEELRNPHSSSSISIGSSSTKECTTQMTPTTPNPIPNASLTPTASELLPTNISETTDTNSVMHRLARFVEHAREANYKLLQKYEASRAECEQLRASLTEQTRHSEAMQRRNEELHQTIQNLRSQLEASGLDAFAVREEAQGLLLRDLQRDVAMEQLKENITRLEQRVQEEQGAKEAFQQDLIRERVEKNELLSKKLRLEGSVEKTKAELTMASLNRATLCDVTVLVQHRLFQAEEECRSARKEAGRTMETLNNVKAEVFGQSLEVQRLKEALEQAKREKEDAFAGKHVFTFSLAGTYAPISGTAELREVVGQLQHEKKATEDAVEHLKSEKEFLLSGLTRTQEHSQRLLQHQTNELANMKQLVKEFAQVRAHFSANQVTREDVEDMCDKLGVDLMVIMNRLQAKYSDSEDTEAPPKKRKLDRG